MTIFEWFVVISLWMHVGLQLVKRREYCSLRVEMTAMVLWPLAVAAGFIFNDSPTLWVGDEENK